MAHTHTDDYLISQVLKMQHYKADTQAVYTHRQSSARSNWYDCTTICERWGKSIFGTIKLAMHPTDKNNPLLKLVIFTLKLPIVITGYIQYKLYTILFSYICTIIHIDAICSKTSLTNHLHRLTIPLYWSLYLGPRRSTIQYHCNDILTP